MNIIFHKIQLKGFSLIESLISLTIISIVLTVFIMSFSKHFNVGRDISNQKYYMTLERIKTEVFEGSYPIDIIVERANVDNHLVKYDLEKIAKATYKLNIYIESADNQAVIHKVLIINDHENSTNN